jgi:hypothetical protein
MANFNLMHGGDGAPESYLSERTFLHWTSDCPVRAFKAQ